MTTKALRTLNALELGATSRAASEGPWVTQRQAADYIGVTERAIRNWIGEGRIQGYRLGRNGRNIRLRRDELDALMTPFGGGA